MSDWLSRLIVPLFYSVSLMPGSAAAQTSASANAQAIFSEAHGKLGSGGTFTAQTCQAAIPQLDEAIALARAEPGDSAITTLSFATLERGYCKLVLGDKRGAVALFQSVVDTGSNGPGNAGIIGPARACLAHAYAMGDGAEMDPVRALGLFVLSDGFRCLPAQFNTASEAADIVIRLDPFARDRSNGFVFQILERGTSMDWLRAVTLYETGVARNTGITNDLFATAMRGLDAGGDSAEDQAARKALNVKLGEWHLFRSRPAVALGYFLAAGPGSADAQIAQLLGETSYQLIIPAGSLQLASHDR